MKRAFKFVAIAALAMGLTVACKQKPAEVEPVDTLNMVEEFVEELDTIAEVAEEAVETTAKTVATTKKAVAKAENKVNQMEASNSGERNSSTTTSSSRIEGKAGAAGARSQELTAGNTNTKSGDNTTRKNEVGVKAR